MKIKALDYGKHLTKLHPYDVKTTGKHPVHMIEGGKYLTEFMEYFNPASDMGVFFLNQKEYEYFKENLIDITITKNNDYWEVK